MAITLAAYALGLVILGCSPRSSNVVREADKLMHQAFLEYAQGSFESASNALQKYTAYLDANEQRIASYRDYDAVDLNGNSFPFPVSRDIPVLQFSPHSMLACMMIHARNTNDALRHLTRAYDYHVQIWAKAQEPSVARIKFAQFVLQSRDKIDAKAGAAWKAQFKLDTNIVTGIVSAWMQQTDAGNK